MENRDYKSVQQLADMLMAEARDGRIAALSPQTLTVVSLALKAFGSHPSRSDIVKAVCNNPQKCSQECFTCIAKANAIQHLFRGDRRDKS